MPESGLAQVGGKVRTSKSGALTRRAKKAKPLK